MSDLSPRSKEKRKLAKHIQRSFKQTGEAPVTTTDFYRVGKLLGKGAFGKVNLAIHKMTEKVLLLLYLNAYVVRCDQEYQQDIPLGGELEAEGHAGGVHSEAHTPS